MEKKLFDLNDGDQFYIYKSDTKLNPTLFEVISPFGVPGIPDMFGYLARTREPGRGRGFTKLYDGNVYVIKPEVNRLDIFTLKENYKVEVINNANGQRFRESV